MDVREGRGPSEFGGDAAETWFRVTGELAPDDASAPPSLTVLHGGPGAAHEYLLSLTDLGRGGCL